MEADQAHLDTKGGYIEYQHVSSAVLLNKEENVQYLAQHVMRETCFYVC